MKTPFTLLLCAVPVVCSCSYSVKLPSVHEPFSSPKWSRCAGDLATRQASALLDDLLLDSQAILCRGAVSASKGAVDESVELFNEAGVRDKEDYRPHYLAGRVLADSGRYEEALTSFERAVRRNPTLSVPTKELGAQVLEKSGPVLAIDFLRKARGRGLCDYECQGFLARTHQEAGQPEEARKVYEEMISDKPEEPSAYVGLASLENASRQFQAEAEQLNRARSAAAFSSLSTTQRADILYSLAFAKYNAGEYDRAAKAMDEALELDDSRATWHLLSGWIELKRDNPEAAAEAFHKAQAADKHLAAAWVGLGDVAMLQGNAASALTNFEKAAQLSPTDAITVLKVAYARALLGEKEEARRLVQQAARLDREHLPAELVEAISALLDEAAGSSGAVAQ